MKDWQYKGGRLYLGNTLLKNFKTPCYVYHLGILEKKLSKWNQFKPKNSRAFYAMKANAHPTILKTIRKNGFGADVVSGGELGIALKAGFKGENIVFSGVGKTEAEIQLALKNNIKSINVESYEELVRIVSLAKKTKKSANVSLRWNPDVGPDTHRYISTGKKKDKFGIQNRELKKCLEFLLKHKKHINFQGLNFHIGSQIQKTAPYVLAIRKTLSWVKKFEDQGLSVKHISVGGGLGVVYRHEKPVRLKQYFKAIEMALKHFDGEIFFEPGRYLTAEIGALISEVQYVRSRMKTDLVILDTGMHHLIRPALYEAFHPILPLKERVGKKKTYDFAGPICESSDMLGFDRKLTPLRQGDLVAILMSGAYGMTMASHYNAHPLPKEYIISSRR